MCLGFEFTICNPSNFYAKHILMAYQIDQVVNFHYITAYFSFNFWISILSLSFSLFLSHLHTYYFFFLYFF